MSLIASAIRIAERAPLPDAVTRLGIDFMVGRRRSWASKAAHDAEHDFVRDMAHHAVAEHTQAANRQHYELPAEFFGATLGPHRKYSCCFYERGDETLEEAEYRALAETAEHADLADGQNILELGCGWGSLTLFMAERFPTANITAISNSTSQRRYIESAARARGIGNVTVVTADMNAFEPQAVFDRIVSVEMFEHMSNWPALLRRTRAWLKPDGRLFVHVFSHKSRPYRFDHSNQADWIAQHFFTGGIMPSHGLMNHFADSFEVEEQWRWNGRHYARTARDWLARFDANRAVIEPILADVYGADAAVWRRRWRLFYLATAGLFGHADGNEWGVSHYRMRPTRK